MPRNLIHVGFPKAGSTTLQAWFSAHPQLRHAASGLAGYHGAHDVARAAATGDDQARWLVTSAEQLVMPIPDAADPQRIEGALADRRRRACLRLRAIFGEATILVVTRGFRAILVSAYAHYVRTGGYARADELFAAVSHDSEYAGNRLEDYFDYDATLALYTEVFGAENLIVLPFELLRDDPSAFQSCLEKRLELDAGGPPLAWLNRSLTPYELYWYPKLSRWATAAGRHPLEVYRRRIDGPKLRKLIALAAYVAPGLKTDVERQLVPGLTERCRGRASRLAAEPLYRPYAEQYLNPGQA